MLVSFLLGLSDRSPIPLEVNVGKPTIRAISFFSQHANARRYGGFCFLFSAILCFIIFISSTIFLEVLYSFQLALIFYPLVVVLLLKLPEIEFSKNVKIIESRIPFALKQLANFLNMRIAYYQAIEIISKKDDEVGRRFKIILDRVDSGFSFQKSVYHALGSLDSDLLKRAAVQLISNYEKGKNADELKRISTELMRIQRYQLRDFSSKSSMFAIVFTATTVIIPMFFLILASLGSLLGTAITEAQFSILLLVVVPLISGLVLLVIKASTPPDIIMDSDSLNMKIIFGTVFVLLVFAASLFIESVLLKILAIAVCIPVSVFLTYREFFRQKRISDLERFIPDALMLLSDLPKGSKMESAFNTISNAGYAALSSEARITLNQLRSNLNEKEALDDFYKRNKSEAVGIFTDTLWYTFQTNSISTLNDLAEDLLELTEIRRQRENALSLQKYTLLLSVFLTPAILKIGLRLTDSISSSYLSTVGIGAQNAGIGFGNIIPVYLIIYSLLISYYLANIENKTYKMIAYLLILTVLSLGIFYIIEI